MLVNEGLIFASLALSFVLEMVHDVRIQSNVNIHLHIRLGNVSLCVDLWVSYFSKPGARLFFLSSPAHTLLSSMYMTYP